jgi:hypothetical protein
VIAPEEWVEFGVNAVFISTPTDKHSLDGVWKESGVRSTELKTIRIFIRWWSFYFMNASSKQEIFSKAPKLKNDGASALRGLQGPSRPIRVIPHPCPAMTERIFRSRSVHSAPMVDRHKARKTRLQCRALKVVQAIERWEEPPKPEQSKNS